MTKQNEQQDFNQLRKNLGIVKDYVQLANKNLAIVQKTLADINANYKKYELHEFRINNDALMDSFTHEIELIYFNKDYIDSLPFKLNNFIKLLIDSGLKDEVLKIKTN